MYLVCFIYWLAASVAVLVNQQGPICASFYQHAADALTQDVPCCFLRLVLRVCVLPCSSVIILLSALDMPFRGSIPDFSCLTHAVCV